MDFGPSFQQLMVSGTKRNNLIDEQLQRHE